MSLWIIVAAMTVLTAVFLAAPLIRRHRLKAPSMTGPDLAVYHAQLRELERDLSSGLISDGEVKAARAEIERRILKAGDAHLATTQDEAPDQQGSLARRPVYAMAFVSLTMIGAIGLYLALGTLGLPSAPLAERGSPTEEHSQDLTFLVDRLAARMEANPSDPRGWLLLARSYERLGRFADSVSAYQRAINLGGREPEILAAYGEALFAAAQGVVTPQARAAFETALADDPGNPWARYYLGLAAAQAGDSRTAYDTWLALAADTPASAPWRAALEAQIRRVADQLGIASADIPMASVEKGLAPPSEEALAAAAEMSDEERAAFIRSMVDRLAARLAAEPDDYDGWMRLGRAYRVLGDRKGALHAYERAAELASTPSFDPAARRAVGRALDELRGRVPSR
ncbi:MAG: c-type cytochrome biogenesis protein CcmI [Rhizobiales bacterium NRL2]|jgi:cytochrome c-type biogenesis protein CcmH|nr:MAG: c-type cytochrome biogenesis protein CcmI [Rhizobiales bacterium NRL2]